MYVAHGANIEDKNLHEATLQRIKRAKFGSKGDFPSELELNLEGALVRTVLVHAAGPSIRRS